MTLPLTLEYKIDAEARRAMLELSGARPDLAWGGYVNTPHTRAMLVCLALAWGESIVSKRPFAFCLGLVAIFVWCRWVYLWGHQARKRVQDWITQEQETPTRLEIREDGFYETDCGVVAFCPWASMKMYAVHEKLVQIALANHLNAFIPASALIAAGTNVTELQALLESRGVPQRGK